jgi:hypothetical protein
VRSDHANEVYGASARLAPAARSAVDSKWPGRLSRKGKNLMKSIILQNGLSRRTNRCLSNAGIPIDRQTIIQALKTGKLFPYHWPPQYGRYAHIEVCRWAGVDARSLGPPSRGTLGVICLGNDLSYRANRCLSRAGIPATRESVRAALWSGALQPGRCPSNYGPKTHAELCQWAGLDPAQLSPAAPVRPRA